MTVILETQSLSKYFGGVHAVENLSVKVQTGEVYAIIGPNGAGKTTVINLVTGLMPITNGHILFKDGNITGRAPHQIMALGVARTYQHGRLFKRLSVLDNVLVGGHTRLNAGWFDVMVGTGRLRAREKELRENSLEVLGELGLRSVADRAITSLSYGQQRLVEMARALVSQPQLLLLDEPAAGLNSGEVDELLRLLRGLRERHLSILLVEHNMNLVMRLADRISVLSFGQQIAEGTPEEIQTNQQVLEAYLGRGYQHVAV